MFQAPAVDVVGIGLSSGKIILHNLKYDETVCSFHQDWGPVTALTFRTGQWRLPTPDLKYVLSFLWSYNLSAYVCSVSCTFIIPPYQSSLSLFYCQVSITGVFPQRFFPPPPPPEKQNFH